MNISTVQPTKIEFPAEYNIAGSTGNAGAYAPSIVIPQGFQGEFRIATKHGRDSFRFFYRDKNGKHGRQFIDSLSDTASDTRLLHILTPGTWSFSAYNETKCRFEKIMTKFIPSGPVAGTFLLGATSRISADKKTCVVYELRLTQQKKGHMVI